MSDLVCNCHGWKYEECPNAMYKPNPRPDPKASESERVKAFETPVTAETLQQPVDGPISKPTASEGWEVVGWRYRYSPESEWMLSTNKFTDTDWSDQPHPLIRQSDAIAYGTRTYNDGVQHGATTAKRRGDRKQKEFEELQLEVHAKIIKGMSDQFHGKLAEAEVARDEARGSVMAMAERYEGERSRYRTLVEGVRKVAADSADYERGLLLALIDREAKG